MILVQNSIMSLEHMEHLNEQILHDARIEVKITQAELASRIGVNKGYISRIENGLTSPNVSTFYRIVNALGLHVEITKPIA